MKKIVSFVLLIFVAGCSSMGRDTVTQVSTIDAILAGAYEGQVRCCDLAEYGNLGIGTFNDLDGEMVFLDGKFYQVRADGKVYSPDSNEKTPFAAVVDFEKDIVAQLDSGLDLSGLEAVIDKTVPNQNIFCALRIKGEFSVMKTRSVPAQSKPYPPLTEVTKNQPVFDMENISGTIVGFRCPSYVKGVSVPGYHLHFISDDFTAGGHILGLSVKRAVAEIDICNRFLLILPDDENGFGKVGLSIDRSDDLKKAEK